MDRRGEHIQESGGIQEFEDPCVPIGDRRRVKSRAAVVPISDRRRRTCLQEADSISPPRFRKSVASPGKAAIEGEDGAERRAYPGKRRNPGVRGSVCPNWGQEEGEEPGGGGPDQRQKKNLSSGSGLH
ncbi:hypothetical protein NDU88_003585 [Pleurodeles waltl]|uniref:Uncharacterized protein n=1 Tax=Pleurodeles waltl TaxID=8319 RepID=A0AAV7M5S9_PLEWA|nr:hypothetical protein NDU88_003585 [Pleurodeles waltl]